MEDRSTCGSTRETEHREKGVVYLGILRVENLSKVYGSGPTQVRALDSVSFTVDQGEFVAVLGPSGSGKSTLLHIIGGVDRPTSGKVYIENTDIYALDETNLAIFRRRQIGLIYQFYNLIPVLNVEENTALPLLLDGREVDKAQLDRLLAKLNLTGRRNHLPNQPGGEQQRVSIGRALISNPALMLADEPTGNLDSANSADIVRLLRQANQEPTKPLSSSPTMKASPFRQAGSCTCKTDGLLGTR